MKRIAFVVGVDEVGRGPLAGPLAVGAVAARDTKCLRGVKDSKQLDALGRERWYRKIKALEKEGKLSSTVAFVSERVIDRKGMSHALRKAVSSCLRRLKTSRTTCILLDGALYAPPYFIRQRTIIRGDERETIIAAASIIAKVRRDRLMKALGKKYPAYLFEVHKGYGTKEHYKRLKKHGISEIHRRSFLKNAIL